MFELSYRQKFSVTITPTLSKLFLFSAVGQAWKLLQRVWDVIWSTRWTCACCFYPNPHSCSSRYCGCCGWLFVVVVVSSDFSVFLCLLFSFWPVCRLERQIRFLWLLKAWLWRDLWWRVVFNIHVQSQKPRTKRSSKPLAQPAKQPHSTCVGAPNNKKQIQQQQQQQ